MNKWHKVSVPDYLLDLRLRPWFVDSSFPMVLLIPQELYEATLKACIPDEISHFG